MPPSPRTRSIQKLQKNRIVFPRSSGPNQQTILGYSMLGLCQARHKKRQDQGELLSFLLENPGFSTKKTLQVVKKNWYTKEKLTTIFLPFKRFCFVYLVGLLCVWIFQGRASKTKKNTNPPPDFLPCDPSFAVDWWPSYSPHHCEQHPMYPDAARTRLGAGRKTCTRFVAGSFPQP